MLAGASRSRQQLRKLEVEQFSCGFGRCCRVNAAFHSLKRLLSGTVTKSLCLIVSICRGDTGYPSRARGQLTQRDASSSSADLTVIDIVSWGSAKHQTTWRIF